MAKEKRGSKDAPCYKQPGGVITGSPQFANDSGFGTPPAPGERGEAYGGDVISHKTPGKNGDFNAFFSKKKGKK